MGTDALSLPARREPAPRRKVVPDGVLGMLLFVFTEAMLFAGMISAFAIVRSGAAGEMWPPYGQPRLPVEETAVNTAALLLSGVTLLVAGFAHRGGARRAVIPLAASVALGLFFVGFQGVEWVRLLAEGLTIRSGAYGGFFYLIVGTHAAHALAALAALGWALARLARGRLTASAFATVRIFWYFVVLVWPVLYWRVYL